MQDDRQETVPFGDACWLMVDLELVTTSKVMADIGMGYSSIRKELRNKSLAGG